MTSRGFPSALSARTRKSFVLFWAALFVLSLMLQYASAVVPRDALAVHDTGLFELDGNAQATTSDDWDLVWAGTDSAFSTEFIGGDAEAPANDATFFQGGGSKDENPIGQWGYSGNDVAPDKDQILDAYAAAYDSGAGTFVYFGADKFDDSGDAQIGFWFFQDAVGLGPNGNFAGAHQVGDLLVLSDFTNGGSVDTIKVYEWDGLGGDNLALVASGVDCSSEPAGDDVCAIVNDASIPVDWPFENKDGETSPAAGQFFEGGLDLNALFDGEPPCFASFLAETRSSQQTDAQLKDFALGAFSTCPTPAIDIVKTADKTALPVGGGTVNYTYTVTNPGNVPLTGVTLTDQLTGTQTDACSPLTGPTGDTNQDSKLDTTETWVWTCSTNITVDTDNTATADSNEAGPVTSHWSVTVVPSNPDVNVVKSVTSTSDQTGATANPGDTLTYTISIQNVGNDAATVDVTDDINDLLAHGDYNNDASPATTSFTAGVLFWDDLSVGAGLTATLTYSVTLDDTFPQGTTHLPNVVVVVGPGSNCPDESEDANCDTDTTVEANPSLVVEKSIGGQHQTTANPGDTITYTITVENTGDADATNVVVTDDITDVLVHASYVSCTNSCSGPDAGDVLTWTLPTVAAGATETVQFTVHLDATGFPVNQTIHLPNTVVVANSNCPAESENPDCSTDTTVLVPGNPAVTISKLVNNVESVTITGGVSTTLTYTILVKNVGNAPTATDYVVTDSAFPAFYSITSVSWTKNGVTTASTSAALLGAGINLGVLGANDNAASGNDEVTVTVTGSASPAGASSGPHVNTAFACPSNAEGNEQCVSDTASVSVSFTPPPPPSGGGPSLGSLTITKSLSPATGFPGGTFTFNVSCGQQQTITVAAGQASGSVTIYSLPIGTSCTVTEVTPLTSPGTGWQWVGQPQYAPGQTVTVPNTVTVTNFRGQVAAATATPTVTLPPTDTITGENGGSPGVNLGLILLILAGITTVLGVLAPVPARIRRRDRRG